MTDLQKQQIIEMRTEGKTYADISEILCLPIGTVKAFCSRNAPKNEPLPIASSETEQIQVMIPEDATIGCKRCGQPLVNTPGHRPKTFCSPACQRQYRQEHNELIQHYAVITITCPVCGKAFSDYRSHNRKYCSHSCYIKHRYGKDDVHETERNNLSCDNEAVPEDA